MMMQSFSRVGLSALKPQMLRAASRLNARRALSSVPPGVSTAIYTWGDGTVGQLGHAKFEKTTPGVAGNYYIQKEPRRLVKSKQYTQIAIGKTFTLGLTSSGSVHGWGQGFIDGKETESKEPILIDFPKKMVKVAAGSKHLAAVDVDGQVYTWGTGGSSGFFGGSGGYLGHNDTKSQDRPKLVEAFKKSGARASQVACGSSHTIILTDDGEVLTCGLGEYGRLGTGSTSDALEPYPIDSLSNDDIKQVAAGQNHSLALCTGGKMYSWGRNDTGALGHADSYIDIYSLEEFPRVIECDALRGDEKVHFVAAGRGTSAAVMESGKLFLWGKAFGHVPTLVEPSAFEGLKVRKVALGGDMGQVVAVITEDDALWTFGDTSSRMLGILNTSGKQPTPARVPAFIGKKVHEVFCGPGQHIAAQVEVPSE